MVIATTHRTLWRIEYLHLRCDIVERHVMAIEKIWKQKQNKMAGNQELISLIRKYVIDLAQPV